MTIINKLVLMIFINMKGEFILMIKYKIYYILLSAFVILYGLYLIYKAEGLINFIDLLPSLFAMYFLNDNKH